MITDQGKKEIEQLVHDVVITRQRTWDEVKADFIQKLDDLLWEDQTRKWNNAIKNHGARG